MGSFAKFLKEEAADSEWSSIYLLLVFIIAALLLVALIKPMFRKSQEVVAKPVVQGSANT
ncbi:MAG: hypothetical protein J4478_01120 [Candidatus Diapherotrites archaeon]|uniref:Uncharacterized protein n=1 Tax=Candidatus Iainarchaeum sp. TaxID=3101447 RepID=A0A7J4JXX6_9ARCH|nr:MAG: hypothetical protein QT12_C0018G0005 [archaeon GW2011_AR21]MBS3057985.1 hypothetical protein [Candidatus Diapherotrites archaeon]HIH21830.1 hypothetical protein [Candidatus Diapherotrites archaeon]HIH33521.1 hypothetical protein [Candidatus Diapherotrites archaeon]